MSHKQPNKDDIYLFNIGESQDAYLLFGSHPKKHGTYFCVWAPNAAFVSVVGTFNDWNDTADPMQKTPEGVWYSFIPNAKSGDFYKYCIISSSGDKTLKSDPFAFYSELRPNNASIIYDIDQKYNWTDIGYADRRLSDPVNSPISIYEIHLGSWLYNGEFPNYVDIADKLAAYITKMGYTHIELLPITEYPLDDSWGYQVTGYFSVSSRYGTPDGLKYLVDKMHAAGIGVILDWVPAHFPKDSHGLAFFDGTPLYEPENPIMAEHGEWGTLVFNYAKPEVHSFLISSAVYFANEFHIDGIRMDAVSSMLYFDYGKTEYIPNADGGNINYDAVNFLKKFNSVMHTRFKNFITIAEESTAYPMITGDITYGGLGFDFKWNLGYMHDTLDYMALDPIYRKYHHNNITFSMCYAFSENFILPYSHDECVHGKGSIINKMQGDYWQKFASLRLLYGYMFAHPGKKLMFMGDEIAQFKEWDYKSSLDWMLLEYDSHKGIQKYISELNNLYTSEPAFFASDNSWEGFTWLSVDDADLSVIVFMRTHNTCKIICAINFTPVVRYDYRIGLPVIGYLTEILNSDDIKFWGSGVKNNNNICIESISYSGYTNSVAITLPPLASVYFKIHEFGG